MSSRLVHRNIVRLASSGLHLTAADIRHQASTHEGLHLSVDAAHVVCEMLYQIASEASATDREEWQLCGDGAWQLLWQGISHVNVTGSSTSSNEAELSRLLYTVAHVEVLKKPEGNSSLSQTISTSSSSAACGVTLDIGKEYLLSVSHVNVLDKETIQGGDPLNDIRYTLKHMEVFKAPNGTDCLAPVVLTSSESSACGISLGNGSEYLLSGSFYNGLFHTSTCGQIVTDDPNDNYSGGLMEWDDVSANFLSRLKSFTC
ncbi:hypothetical protein TELCIR_09789 [Teladorsagia circumcincta]|uniref:NTR domain-containing protein n=1 Tax=Teladorsagia circumcincta TaxID=45464 RepID=A0A2G9UE45_TELCI|nr:hypothetical protein TELCIR_09789 [Teladorsagia circumcincta]